MVSKDAYYPFGMRIEGLSQTVDDPDPRYKYNGKELDEEKGLNWLAYGARYYDPELGRWHVVDPAEVEFGLYNYVYNNPVYYIDPDGRVPDVIFDGTAEDIQAAADYLDMESSLDITIDLETGKLYAEGKAESDADKELLKAIKSPDVNVVLKIREGFVQSIDGSNLMLAPGAYDGNYYDPIIKKTITSQFINLRMVEGIHEAGGAAEGRTLMHEVLESWSGATGPWEYRGFWSQEAYNYHHAWANKLANEGIRMIHKMNEVTGMPVVTINSLTQKIYRYGR